MPSAKVVALLAGCCLVSSACGSSPAHRTTATFGGLPQTGSPGAVVFARSCAACHSLIGSEAEHKQGGDLLDYDMSRAQLLGFTRVMPTRRPLTRAELESVVDYVLRAQRRAGAAR